jgi:NAD(P)-dependent dehydrogenase (short-subunit alcohol dehydrogenase family)
MKPLGVQVAMVEPGAIKTPLYTAPQAAPMADYSPCLRWLLPAGAFEASVRRGFNLDKEAPFDRIVKRAAAARLRPVQRARH